MGVEVVEILLKFVFVVVFECTPSNRQDFQTFDPDFVSDVHTAFQKDLLAVLQVVLLGYHWSSREYEDDLLVHKPVAKWTPEEVILWLEQLGPWASLYRDRFLLERVNGR